ncbi:MAG TPA: phosphotransferase [Streptosporangiaceae bacterium]|jgi:hypothetical protein
MTSRPGDQERLGYLRDTAALLWPAPARVTPGADQGGKPPLSDPVTSEFFLIPSESWPRLLVPATRRAAAAAVRRYGEPGSRTGRLRATVLSLGLSAGLGRAALRSRLRVQAPAGASTIETYLSEVLDRDVRVSMHLGPARANRKPVLQLLSARGETVGYAKIGISELTRELVRAEHQALSWISQAGLASVAAPEVLHLGRWQELDVLVLGALPVWLPRRPLGPDQLTAAMAEVAGLAGLRQEKLADGDYLARLGDRLSAADQGDDRDALSTALAALAGAAGATVLDYGHWHGDWTPWNMASTRQGLLLWDWERFTGGVPVGFDALHHRLQTQVIPERREPAVAARDCIETAPARLAPFGVGAEEATLTALLYLTDLATRYLVDRQATAGARLGSPGTWLIPAIASAVGRL